MLKRDAIKMTDDEMRVFVRAHRTVILSCNGAEGYPLSTPMWYAIDKDGAFCMATFRKSLKVKNIERDNKVSLLVESGVKYAELKGVLTYSNAELITDLDRVTDTLIAIAGTDPLTAGADPGSLREALQAKAAKRVLIYCKPIKVVTWDHAKLAGGY